VIEQASDRSRRRLFPMTADHHPQRVVLLVMRDVYVDGVESFQDWLLAGGDRLITV
jgi:hypothetical protein